MYLYEGIREDGVRCRVFEIGEDGTKDEGKNEWGRKDTEQLQRDVLSGCLIDRRRLLPFMDFLVVMMCRVCLLTDIWLL